LNDAAELKLTVFDALNQNKSVSTTVTDYYKEYDQNLVLKQYFMLTFTYNLKLFNMAAMGGMRGNRDGDHPPPPPPDGGTPPQK
jgi:hypothetical protein